MSPLKFPWVFSVLYRWDKIPASSSLKVVLPMLPVTWTTGRSNCPRYQEARARRAVLVSATSM